MIKSSRLQRKYDHRLRDLVFSTGDIKLALDRGVPRSTARGWLRIAPREVVSVQGLDHSVQKLRQEVFELRRRNAKLRALLRLLLVLIRVSGFSINGSRLPEGSKKRAILRAVESARSTFKTRAVLRVLRLNPRRYRAWRNADQDCGLDDVTSCPRVVPHQLTSEEVATVKEMVTSREYRHVPTGTLAILAQRLGKVFASPATWHRLIRVQGWRRPRRRIHPAKPKVGIRASKPDGIWHIDTTLIRLLDGTRAYLHAVIDNFSRRILAWKISDKFEPTVSAELLLSASKGVVDHERPTLLTDGGIENYNSAVDELIETGRLRRLLAMTDITYSNSLIESWWRSLKHQWLYLNSLDSIAAVKRLVAFYVTEHNERLPHSAFRGQTPDEMYFGTGNDIPRQLEARRATARSQRLEENRSKTCSICETPDVPVAV
jgi:transposase InsO family protein